MQELKNKQASGAAVATVKGNKNSQYELPENEQHLIHAEIHAPQYNQQTGEDEGTKFVQKFYPVEFAQMQKDKAFAGKKVTIFHQPEEGAATVTAATGTSAAATEAGAQGQGAAQTGGDGKEKNLHQWKNEDLLAEYQKLYGDDADPELKERKALITAIEEKREFLAKEGAGK